MVRLVFSSMLLAAVVCGPPALAAARGASAAILNAPTSASLPAIIDGRVWRCAQTACTAAPSSAAESQPAPRECARVAAKLGAVTAFESGPRGLDAAEIAACNVSAAKPR